MMRKVYAINAAVLVAVAFLSLALQAQTKPADIAGKWTLDAADGPHGPMSMTLVLAQKGQEVSGTLTIPQAGDMKMTGTFDGVKLTMATAPGGDHGQLTLSATLKQSTLSGHLSSERGDVKWTGKRQ